MPRGIVTVTVECLVGGMPRLPEKARVLDALSVRTQRVLRLLVDAPSFPAHDGGPLPEADVMVTRRVNPACGHEEFEVVLEPIERRPLSYRHPDESYWALDA